MSKQNRFYDQEFKDNAARYCLEKAPSITQGAKDLNLNKCSVFKWVVYSDKQYDQDRKNVSGSANILTYWELKKTDGKWNVVDIKEHP